MRLMTAAAVARRLRSVRVPRYGLITMISPSHSTPMAAQLTVPSGLIVVVTVSTIGPAARIAHPRKERSSTPTSTPPALKLRPLGTLVRRTSAGLKSSGSIL